jgi:hypothetical protein
MSLETLIDAKLCQVAIVRNHIIKPHFLVRKFVKTFESCPIMFAHVAA